MHRRILITGDFEPNHQLARLVATGFTVKHLRRDYSLSELRRELASTTDYILGGPEYLDGSLLETAPALTRVAVMGTGTSSFIDLKHAAARGITVMNTPGINAPAVAEFALGMIITSLAKAIPSFEGVRDGNTWLQRPRKSLCSAHLGLIGLGNVGQALAAKLRLLSGGRISYFNRTRRPDLEDRWGLRYLPLPDLLAQTDLCTIQLRYCEDTHHSIDSSHLDGINPGLHLLNFSNPNIVDPVALASALPHRKIAFAYIDGFYNEWLLNLGRANDSTSLLSLPSDQFQATSHIAAQEEYTVLEVFKAAVDQILTYPDPIGRNSHVQYFA